MQTNQACTLEDVSAGFHSAERSTPIIHPTAQQAAVDPHSLQFYLPNIIFALCYLFIIWEKVPKVIIALIGAGLVILLNVVSFQQAITHIDLNVIFLLVGMMIIVNILTETGAFNWLAYAAAKRVNGSGVKLMLVFCIITAVASAFLDNVTTVLFMSSITCSLASRLKVNPIPYLIPQVLASNIGGTATLIGDPPNILIGSASGLSFTDFMVNLTPVIAVILVVSLVILYLIYRKDLVLSEEAINELEQLSLDGLITNKPLMLKALGVLSLVLLAFVFHHVIHQEVGVIALTGAAILMLFENSEDIWNDVEWTTIFFFIGLFILVGAVTEVGTLDILAKEFLRITNGDFQVMSLSLLWISGIASAIIDNIPYTATMIPFIQGLGQHYDNVEPLWWSLALGACLGGNGTIIGATANVLVVDIAKRNGSPILFMEFLKVGGLIMIVSLAISTGFLWIRYF